MTPNDLQRFTTTDGRTPWVNVNQILYIDANHDGAVIHMADGNVFEVALTPDQVAEQIIGEAAYVDRYDPDRDMPKAAT